MNHDPLEHLISKARRALPAGEAEQEQVPLGFASRVVARADIGGDMESLEQAIGRRAWRVLGIAGSVAGLTVALNLSAVTESYEIQVEDDTDPVAEVLDL